MGCGPRPSAMPLRQIAISGLSLAALVALGGTSRAVAESLVAVPPQPPSFVVIGTSPERAALIAAHAEGVRASIQTRLLGRPAPEPWRPRCELHVHATADSFTSAVGMPPLAARGATSLEFAGDRVSLRRIDVMGDGGEPIPEALDHEIVHVVLGDRFTEVSPPRWADEGLAILFDSPAIRQRHEADFRAALDRGQAWPVRELLLLDLDPSDLGRQRVFYGQSGSLVRWLLARGGAATLLAFSEDAAFDGPAAALRAHYGFDSAEALEAAWRADLPPL